MAGGRGPGEGGRGKFVRQVDGRVLKGILRVRWVKGEKVQRKKDSK